LLNGWRLLEEEDPDLKRRTNPFFTRALMAGKTIFAPPNPAPGDSLADARRLAALTSRVVNCGAGAFPDPGSLSTTYGLHR
jgi:hypothetical protein